ncbi:hypothetical protein [Klebsiella aerogenes]|uniref:hypothetical protein n=1 Tax=Klebsiella aerogenes TaxID=548 RepID=UPI002FFD4D70
MMIKKIILLACSFSLISCALSPGEALKYQSEHDFENTLFQTKSNEKLSVFNLRNKYKNTTGKELPNQNTASCQKDASCYYNKYAVAYDSLIKEYQERKRIENKKYAEEKEAECQASKECMTKRKIDSASYDLNSIYYSIMAQNPYLQADYDAAVRRMCRSAGEAQRNGVSLDQMQKNIDLVEGIAPTARYQIKQVAKVCWTLSKYGVPDGTTQIKPMY